MDNRGAAKPFALGFVIYKPEPELIERIANLTKAGYQVYLFDNSPDVRLIRDAFRREDAVHYFSAGKNVGLGYGLSMIGAHAYYDGYSSLLFFDQDTRFGVKTLVSIQQVYECMGADFSRYAVIAFNAKSEGREPEPLQFGIIEQNFVISSGSLFNLDVLKKLNWHNHRYFVDGVDYELCLKAHLNGFLIGEYPYTPGFDHISGQADRPYSVWGKKLMLRAYNRSRIMDTLGAYRRLMGTSLQYLNLRYFLLSVRSCIIYCFFQILVRILNITK